MKISFSDLSSCKKNSSRRDFHLHIGSGLLGLLLLFLMQSSGICAEEQILRASAVKESALYRRGESIVFQVSLEDAAGKLISGSPFSYEIEGDGGLKTSGNATTGPEPVKISTVLNQPGFVRLTVRSKIGNRMKTTWAGAGVDVEQIQAATPAPADFNEFWQKQLQALRSRKYQTTLNRISDPKIRLGTVVYEVILKDPQLQASGFLVLPPNAAPKSHPLILTFNGASKIGAFYSNWNMAHAYKSMVFNMNIHDTITLPTAEQIREMRRTPPIRHYQYNKPDQIDEYALRKVFLRIARCIDYLKTRPEWDGRTIVSRGGSLGGAQAIVAAYFEPKTVLCIANAPALCDHYGADRKQSAGWPGIFRFLSRNNSAAIAGARKNMVYFDMVNFARNLRCPIAMSVGFIDYTCPPTSVYAAYNSLPGQQKSIRNIVLGLHGLSLKKGEPSVFNCGGPLVREACLKARKNR